MHFLYALVGKSSFSKAQGFVKPARGIRQQVFESALFIDPRLRSSNALTASGIFVAVYFSDLFKLDFGRLVRYNCIVV